MTRSCKRLSQDFSATVEHPSLTDTSFGPACDVNAIVRHYESTGVDHFQSRKQQERFGDASSTSYSEAMRQKAEVDSAFELLPAAERAEHDNSALSWLEYLEQAKPPQEAPESPPDPPAEPPPEAATEPQTEAK